MRAFFDGFVARIHDKLIFDDIPLLGNRSVLDYPVGGVVLLSRYEEYAVFRPSRELFIIHVPTVDRQDGALGESERVRDVYLVHISLGYTAEDRKIYVVVQQQVKLDSPFLLPILCPVKQGGEEFYQRGIKDEQLVLEPKRLLSVCQAPALGQELIKHLLIKLPWPMFVGIGEGGTLRSCIDAQMSELAQTGC